LASSDASKAFRAVVELEASPKPAASILAEHVKPVPAPDANQLRKWIADLDNDRFEAREKASEALGLLRELARPALEEARNSKSPEVRRRVEELLSRLKPDANLSDEDLRRLRAIEILENTNTPEARHLLRALSRGAEGAWLTREANKALESLETRRR
jgi:hypothetical protein